MKFGQVVRELQHSRNGVLVTTEDGCVYEANYVILSVSIGVLQSNLISIRPHLPVRLIFLPKIFNPTSIINRSELAFSILFVSNYSSVIIVNFLTIFFFSAYVYNVDKLLVMQ